MKHYYLNEIGIKSDDCCIFNTCDKKVGKNFLKFKKEKAQHTFDSRETWAMDYTSATWLYEHLCLYKDLVGKYIDLNSHTIEIPVLFKTGDGKLIERLETQTKLEAINLIICYLKEYFTMNTESIDQELLQFRYLKTAFKIYAEIITALWW